MMEIENAKQLSREQQIELLEQYDNKILEVLEFVKDLSTGAERLSSLNEVQKYVELFKTVHTFRDIYTWIFDDTAERIANNRDCSSGVEQDFLNQYVQTQRSIDLLEDALIECYRKDNVTDISAEEIKEGVFRVGVKVKNISPAIMEEAIEICNKRGKYQVEYAELSDQEDMLYVYGVSISCAKGSVDEAISAIKEFVLFSLRLMCKYQVYREELYLNVFNRLLDKQNQLAGIPSCTLMDFTPRQWQREAFEVWGTKDANYHGTFSVCTGAGKTKFSLYCLQQLIEQGFNIKTSIIVPTRAIMQVWYKVLTEDFHVSPKEIGRRGDGYEKCYWNDKRFMIYISNTAQKELASDILALEEFSRLNNKNYYQCLIADECHHYGSDGNLAMFDGLVEIKLNEVTGIDYFAMGLSATPERYDKKEQYFFQVMGDIVYRYSILEALADGVISPFTIENVDCPLDEKELEKLAEYNKRYSMSEKTFAQSALECKGEVASFVSSIRNQNEEGAIVGVAFGVVGEYAKKLEKILKKYEELKTSKGESPEFKAWLDENDDNKVIYYAYKLVEAYNSRRAFIQNAKSREEKCLKLAAENINRKVIVFCEYIESADLIYKALLELYGSEKIKRYYSATKKQTKESRWEVYQREKENREALDAFVYGNASVIVTVKSFNEGVDISSADVAIVYQNTVSVRESIQRLGRIVRRSKNGDSEADKKPILYHLYAKKQKEKVYLKEFFAEQISEQEQNDSAKVEKCRKGLEMITLIPSEEYKLNK